MLNARFEEAMCQRVRQWMILAQEKLVPAGIQFFFMPGNDDLQSIDDIIAEFEQVHNPDMRRFEIIGGYEVLGNSNANMTPWACARDLEEDDLEHKMQELAELIGDPQRAICAIHVPPFQSGLDTCPELDKNLKIVTMGGQVMMKATALSAGYARSLCTAGGGGKAYPRPEIREERPCRQGSAPGGDSKAMGPARERS